jgi:hypothetical protein
VGEWAKRVCLVACAVWGGLCAVTGPVAAGEPDGSAAPAPSLHRSLDRSSDFAPVGVLLDHTHVRGDWTFLYRYARYEYRDLLEGDTPVTPAEVGARYPDVPLSWVRQVHTIGAMYAPRDRLTFALLLPVVVNSLEESVSGVIRESDTSGIGDAKLMFLVPFVQKGREMTQLNFGVSFPTGSIQQTQPGTTQRLPYLMQLGSGSWDLIWGVTYTGQHEAVSWGGQFEGQYRISENAVGYRLGTVYSASAWVSGAFGRWFSASGRFAWTKRGNIRGQDPTLDKTLSPLNDNKLQGGTTLEVGPGINVLLPLLGGQRLSVEALVPIYQNLDGPQLAADITVIAGWQWIF